MAFTCYAQLTSASLGSAGPPAQIEVTAGYNIVNTTTNAATATSDGSFTGQLDLLINCPIASQQALLPAIQAAIQAKEPATPSLSFIWIGL